MPPRRHRMCQSGFVGTKMRAASMSEIGILSIDLAKNSFQVCGVRSDGVVVFNRAVSRGRLVQLLADQPPCIVAMEACGTSHHWGRVALGHAATLRSRTTRLNWIRSDRTSRSTTRKDYIQPSATEHPRNSKPYLPSRRLSLRAPRGPARGVHSSCRPRGSRRGGAIASGGIVRLH